MICRDICRRKGGVAFCRDADILPRDFACDRGIGFRIRTDGCDLGGEKSALLVPNAIVILGYLPSFCEGNVISGGKGSCAAFAFDDSCACRKVISCGEGDSSTGVNLCAKFRTALCTKIVLRT